MNSYYKIKIRLIAGAVVMAMTMVLNLAKDIGLINLTSKQAGSLKTSISIQTLFRYSQGIYLSERTGARMSGTKIKPTTRGDLFNSICRLLKLAAAVSFPSLHVYISDN